jgi:peptide-methionine (S)-S-oxide reductase
MKTSFLLCITFLSFGITSCAQKKTDYKQGKQKSSMTIDTNKNLDTATFGAGCFWCVEAQFQLLDGVFIRFIGVHGWIY